MKIFLTGGTGMVGKNILENAKSNDHIFAAPSSEELNLLDLNAVTEALSKEMPDLVIHSAGLVGYPG